jgi:Ca-activated chloride channel family protein
MVTDYVREGRIPSQAHINSGIFATHYFDIKSDLEVIDELVAVKFFSATLPNPLRRRDEHLFVIGLTGSADGKNERPKTDVILVLDRSGSMSSPLKAFSSASGPRASPEPEQTKMQLTIEAAKQIFDLLDNDECIGVIAFDDRIDVLAPLTPKMTIDRGQLFGSLDLLGPRGGTNMEIGLSSAIEMLQGDPNVDRNKRIIFITDACPNAGTNEYGLRAMAEQAFVSSSGTICVTYVGVGLTFDPAVCSELARVRGTTVFTVNTPGELHQGLVEDFNYTITPIAFDVKVRIESDGAEIDGSRVYGADDDAGKSGSMLEIRTLTASAIRGSGVKGSVIIVFLKDPSGRGLRDTKLRVHVEYLPSGERDVRQRVYESVFKVEANPVVEKAFALAIYFETLKEVLPRHPKPCDSLGPKEMAALSGLRDFLTALPPALRTDLFDELQLVKRIISA